MTARCQGADSRVKPGVPLTAQIGHNIINAAISELFPPALPIAILLEAFTLSMETLCPSDPPPMPVFDLNDLRTFTSGALSPYFLSTSAKMGDLLRNWAWPMYCECVDGSPPLQVAPPLPPQGSSYGSYTPNRACASGGWAGNAPLGNAEPAPSNTGVNVGYRLLPTDGTTRVFTAAGSTYTGYKLLTGVTRAEWTRKAAEAANPTTAVGPNIEIREWTDTNTLINTHNLDWVPPTPQDSGSFSIGTTARWLTAYAGAEPILGAFDDIIDPLVTCNIQWYCGGTSDTLSNCCPPDPAIALTLNNLVEIVTNIQNQLAGGVKGYVDGVRHANCSGTGSFPLVGDARAVRVETHPPGPPVIVVPGTPSHYFDMGFITPYILQSPLRSTRLTFNPMVIELPRFTDQVGYTLLNGITVDIVELVPDSSAASP